MSETVEPMTVDDVLRDPILRAKAREVAASGRTFTRKGPLGAAAKPAVIRAAVRKLSDRLARRIAFMVGDGSRNAPSGYFLLMCLARRDDRTRNIFRRYVSQMCFDHARAGDHMMTIHLVNDTDDVRAFGGSSKGSQYSHNCIWRKTNSHHTYFIQRDWPVAVAYKGLAVINGYLTLWLGEPSPYGDVSVRPGRYVCQGRGFALDFHTGWLATRDGAHVHSDVSALAAVVGLQKQLQGSRASSINRQAVKAAQDSAAAAKQFASRQKSSPDRVRRVFTVLSGKQSHE